MRIAVVSNGPSAAEFDNVDASDYRFVVGVNDTARRWTCHWWSAIDWQMFCGDVPLGSPKLFTRGSTPEHIREHGTTEDGDRIGVMLWRGDVLPHGCMAKPPLPDDCPPWNCYSGTAALILAWHLRPTHVDMFGFDMAGETDSRGKSWHTRTNIRWDHEKRIVTGIMSIYRAAEISVTLHDGKAVCSA